MSRKGLPIFNNSLYRQFIKECCYCFAVQIQYNDTTIVIPWSHIHVIYSKDEDNTREEDKNKFACIFTEDGYRTTTYQIPFSSFMSHMKPIFKNGSYKLAALISENDPILTITFLYPKSY